MKVGCQMAFNDRTSPDYIREAGRIAEEIGIPLPLGAGACPLLPGVPVALPVFGYNLTPSRLEERIAKLDVFLKEGGRMLSDIQIYVNPAPEAVSPDVVKSFRVAGSRASHSPPLRARCRSARENCRANAEPGGLIGIQVPTFANAF